MPAKRKKPEPEDQIDIQDVLANLQNIAKTAVALQIVLEQRWKK